MKQKRINKYNRKDFVMWGKNACVVYDLWLENKMIFLLEDDKNRIKWFRKHWPNMLHADNPVDGLRILQENDDFEFIFLDHDLGGAYTRGPQGDGIDLAKDMARLQLHTNVKVIVHSLNPVGARNIANELASTHDDVAVLSFIELKYLID